MQNFGMSGLSVLVTGASGDIGSVISAQLEELGCRVARADVVPASDQGTKSYYALDIRDNDSCAKVVEEVNRDHSGLDVLINCAGIRVAGRAHEVAGSDWADTLDVNVTGTFRMCQAAHKYLVNSKNAAIVNFGSTAGEIPIPGSVSYAVSKAAISHMTPLLAFEWAHEGIRVNAVAPTIVITKLNAAVRAIPGYLERKLGEIPLHKAATIADVAWGVIFLASPISGMVTGQVLNIDGGCVSARILLDPA